RKRVELPGNTFKNVGKYKVAVKLYESAAAEVSVTILGQALKVETKAPPANKPRRRRDAEEAEAQTPAQAFAPDAGEAQTPVEASPAAAAAPAVGAVPALAEAALAVPALAEAAPTAPASVETASADAAPAETDAPVQE
ncbi:MAG: hypothetical protein LBP23_06245, partial [Treponema sp.]|nr:hypothetical protein [Treponema sp.]